jgi:hypothetical protein
MKLALAAGIQTLLFSVLPCLAQDKHVCEVKVATLTVPDGSDGLVHWRSGNTPTEPLQLSTRYFSESLKLESNIIQFFNEPVLAASNQDPPPTPLVTLRIPEGRKLVYIVLTADSDENNRVRWRGSMLDSGNWKAGSMKLFNSCSETLGIAAGSKRIQLLQGKSVDFHVSDWGESFPVKIFRLKPELKTVFSSTWRVTAGRRELCFIGSANGSVKIRSLLDLAANPPNPAP